MDLYYKEKLIVPSCFKAAFILQGFDIKRIDLSNIAENCVSGEITLTVAVSKKRKLEVSQKLIEVEPKLRLIYEDFYNQINSQKEDGYSIVLDVLELSEDLDFSTWIFKNWTNEQRQEEIVVALLEHFFDSAITSLPERYPELISNKHITGPYEGISQALQDLETNREELAFYQSAPSDIGLMVGCIAMIIGVQVYLWHQLAKSLVMAQSIKGLTRMYWTFGLSTAGYGSVIILLCVPLFFLLRGSRGDLFKWLKIAVKLRKERRKK